MRDEGHWIDVAIKVIFVVSVILAIAGIFAAGHFIVRFW